MEKELKPGHKAPDFTLSDQDDKSVSLKGFKGKWVVLYFYPKDNTPGCALEAKEFSDSLDEFFGLDAVILGVSADSRKSHCDFIRKQGLKITLLSDPDQQAIISYGVWQKKKNYGREYMGLVRSTFLIDPRGKIARAWSKVKAKGHALEVKEELKALKNNST